MISIPGKVLRDIWEDGERAYPEEGAGLLLGRLEGGTRFVERILPLSNQFDTNHRHRRYLITPEDMIAAEDIADDLELEIIGIFHSHPDHPPQPSDYDRDHALPWYSYLITSIRRKVALESRSWRFTEDRVFIEEKLLVEQEMKLEKK